MAKKFVRGITDVNNINKQDFDTNNVNDILSDGEHTYIHRKKKDGTQEYHNLTDNIKTIEKVDNGLLTVTNYNKTKNSATLHVHHDYYKSQRISSPDGTINVTNGENGTDENTTVDVNPSKIQEIVTPEVTTFTHENGTLTIMLQPTGNNAIVFRFNAYMKKGMTSAEFVMPQTYLDFFEYLILKYGLDRKINVNGSAFQMYENATRVYFNSNASQYNPHLMHYYEIIPIDPATGKPVRPTPLQTPATNHVQKGDSPTLESEKVETLEKVEKLETGKVEEL